MPQETGEAIRTDGAGPRVEGDAPQEELKFPHGARSAMVWSQAWLAQSNGAEPSCRKSQSPSSMSACCPSFGEGNAGQTCVATVPMKMQARLPRSMAVANSAQSCPHRASAETRDCYLRPSESCTGAVNDSFGEEDIRSDLSDSATPS